MGGKSLKRSWSAEEIEHALKKGKKKQSAKRLSEVLGEEDEKTDTRG